MAKQVVIVGKPNVGKSQLFNRLVGEKHSIVVSEPGVTRDRITLETEWLGNKFLLTDTGGYTTDDYSFQEEINRQTEIAFSEADLLLFIVSCKEGIDNDDIYLSKMLKKNKFTNVIVVANKCDCQGVEELEEYKLGFGKAIYISAEHGINTGELLNSIVSKLSLEPSEEKEESEKRFKLAIIGKPNVGKSSLVNSLLKKERIITSEIAGTTRDAIDLDFDYGDKKYRLIDTPGIRRHASIYKDEKEKYSILRAKKAVSRANMMIFVFDISETLTELDERIGSLAFDANIPTVIVANKWDLIEEKTDSKRREIEKDIKDRFKFLNWAPIVFVSAKESLKLDSIFKKIEEIRKEVTRKISPYLLNDFMHKISLLFSVPQVKGNVLKLFSMSQIEGQVPTFLFFCNNPEFLHFSYARLVENQIRTCFGYKITPITVIYKKKNNSKNHF